MKYKIYIGDRVALITEDLQNALKIISQIFRDGHTDVYLYGGKLGKWR